MEQDNFNKSLIPVDTLAETLEKLANSESDDIRRQVASNPNTPPNILKRLFIDYPQENLENSKIVEFNPKIKRLIKWIGGISLSLTIILLSACLILLLSDYLLDRVFYEEFLIQRLNLSFGRPEIRYLCFKIIGYSLLIIASILGYVMEESLTKIRMVLFTIALFNLVYALNIFLNFSPDVFHWNQYVLPNNVLTIVVHCTCTFAVFTNVLFYYRERDKDKLINLCGYLMFLTVAMTT